MTIRCGVRFFFTCGKILSTLCSRSVCLKPYIIKVTKTHDPWEWIQGIHFPHPPSLTRLSGRFMNRWERANSIMNASWLFSIGIWIYGVTVNIGDHGSVKMAIYTYPNPKDARTINVAYVYERLCKEIYQASSGWNITLAVLGSVYQSAWFCKRVQVSK